MVMSYMKRGLDADCGKNDLGTDLIFPFVLVIMDVWTGEWQGLVRVHHHS